jgi:hypothetical protein
MKSRFNLTLLLAVSTFLLSLAAHAQIPGGRFQGSVSNNPFNEWCRMTDATVEFMDAGQGRFQMVWQEEGFSPNGGFCEAIRDALLLPTDKKGEWRVDFQDFNLTLGRAYFDPATRTLRVLATYHSMNTGFSTLEGRFQFNDDGARISYSRMIGRQAASTLFANGNLYRR